MAAVMDHQQAVRQAMQDVMSSRRLDERQQQLQQQRLDDAEARLKKARLLVQGPILPKVYVWPSAVLCLLCCAVLCLLRCAGLGYQQGRLKKACLLVQGSILCKAYFWPGTVPALLCLMCCACCATSRLCCAMLCCALMSFVHQTLYGSCIAHQVMQYTWVETWYAAIQHCTYHTDGRAKMSLSCKTSHPQRDAYRAISTFVYTSLMSDGVFITYIQTLDLFIYSTATWVPVYRSVSWLVSG